MNLIVDQGNSAIKIAGFRKNKIQFKKVFQQDSFEKELETLLSEHDFEKCIFSGVGKDHNDLIEKLENYLPVLELTNSTNLPFINLYATPETLGRDRIALAAAGKDQFPGKNALIIDCGTCITYDLKNDRDEYLGGGISPGIRMRFESLHKFTANLPLVTPKPEANLIGKDTQSSILSGIINGTKMEIQGVVRSYQEQFTELSVIFTGGDSEFLSIPLKNSIFANPNFLLEGLNFILEFNTTP